LTGDWNLIHSHLIEIHKEIRHSEGLPSYPPRSGPREVKLKCNLCLNECILSQKDVSYCGLRSPEKNDSGILSFPTKTKGYIHGYIDANPTNCCNSWFCPAGTDCGYPLYSAHKGPEYGTYSYAAFLYGCTFNCLFCQNASHKHISRRSFIDANIMVQEIMDNKKISCLCYFGGTPEAQLPYTIYIAEKLLQQIEEQDKGRIMRICWEWNGSGNQNLIEKCMKIAIKSGGNIKFDLKSYNEKLNIMLCGISNKRTLENFEFLAKKYFGKRKGLPEMSACTLLVPGYINEEEVELIAKFIHEINDEIPYSLLIFHPDYKMDDIGYTTKEQALKCVEINFSSEEVKKFLLKNYNLITARFLPKQILEFAPS